MIFHPLGRRGNGRSHNARQVTDPDYWEQFANQPWPREGGYRVRPVTLALVILLWMLLITVLCIGLAIWYLPEPGPSIPRRTRPSPGAGVLLR